jgi:signal transduction histidine kinase
LLLAALMILSGLGIVSVVSALVGNVPFAPISHRIVPAPLAILAGVAVFSLVFAVLRGFGSPLGDIVEAANRVADGDLSTRVTEYGPPSLRIVGRAFNSMAAQLESHEQQRRHLMADIAHELRTPLSVIQGRLEGFLDGVYPRDDAKLAEVLEETKLLGRLVDDLRTLADAESGTLALHKETTDVAVLVQDVVSAFSGDADRRQVAVRFDAPPDLPAVTVDPIRLREVLSNLLSNALRYTPAGGTVSIVASLQGDRIVVSVADTGTGIAPDELPKIFDRFHKGTASRGSGLGLTIAKDLVRAHGGENSAHSRLGHGATVTLTLPVG